MNKSKLTLETETEHLFNTEYHKILNIFRPNDYWVYWSWKQSSAAAFVSYLSQFIIWSLLVQRQITSISDLKFNWWLKVPRHKMKKKVVYT